MAEKSDESTIVKLLEDLHSAETYNRNDAIKTIIKNKINDERVIDSLLHSVSNDPSLSVRNFARSALDVLGVEHSDVEKDEPVIFTLKKDVGTEDEVSPVVEVPPEPVTDLRSFLRRYNQQVAGFIGWYIINIVIWLLVGTTPGESADIFINLLLFPANVLILIVLAAIKSTRRIASGILIALAFNLLVSLIMGVSLNGWCFIPFIFPAY